MVSPASPLTVSFAARRAAGTNASALAVSLQRLSSGLRVNSARDDAAGLAIAERMTARLRGAQQAVRNANDGISLFQTAEGALGAMGERLQRMRELVVQALNEVTSTADRASLDREVRQSLAELDRQASSTRFNGRALLDGSFGTATFQVGAGALDGLDIALDADLRAAELGAVSTAATSDLRTAGNRSGGFVFAATYTTVAISDLDFSRPEVRFAGGAVRTTGTPPLNYSGGGAAQFTVDGASVSLNANYGSLGAVASAMQAQLNAARPGGYAVTHDGTRLAITRSNSTSAPVIANASGAAGAYTGATSIAGTPASPTSNAGFAVDGRRVAVTANHSGNFAALVADIQGQLDASARGAYRVSGSDGGISITRSTGTAPPVVDAFTGAGASVFASVPQTGLTLAAGDLYVQLGTRERVAVTGTFLTPESLAAGVRAQVRGVTTLVNDSSGALEINATETITLSGAAAASDGALAFTRLVNEAEGSLQDVDATLSDVARRSLLRIDAALDRVNAQRGSFGALQSRFDAMVGQLRLEGEHLGAARGRIVDADMAAESAALARRNVLQRAAQAMLAQANVMPRQVLALLR
jgi:flagellin